jgi:hypothetical protein
VAIPVAFSREGDAAETAGDKAGPDLLAYVSPVILGAGERATPTAVFEAPWPVVDAVTFVRSHSSAALVKLRGAAR